MACLSSHCAADFRSWETLHSGLIWSLGFSELFKGPSNSLSLFLFPPFCFPCPSAALLCGGGEKWTERGLAEGTFGSGFPSETPLAELEHQGQFCAWRMGEESPSFLFRVMGSYGSVVGVNGLPRASGGQAPRPRSLLGLAFAVLHIVQPPPFLGAVIQSWPLLYQLLLALQEASSDISGPPTSPGPVGCSLSPHRREKSESVISRVRLETHRMCPILVKWIALPLCKMEIMG